MEDFIEGLPKWLRWVIALPGAILCSWILGAAFMWFNQSWNGVDGMLASITGTFTGTLIFAYFLYKIVPSHRFICSIIVNSLICGTVLLLMISDVLHGTGDESLLVAIINDLIIIGVMVWGYHSIHHPYILKASI